MALLYIYLLDKAPPAAHSIIPLRPPSIAQDQSPTLRAVAFPDRTFANGFQMLLGQFFAFGAMLPIPLFYAVAVLPWLFRRRGITDQSSALLHPILLALCKMAAR